MKLIIDVATFQWGFFVGMAIAVVGGFIIAHFVSKASFLGGR